MTATLDEKRDTDFDAIAAPTNYDSITQQFNMMVVENVIELVMKANPNEIMVITSTVPVRYMASVRERYHCKNIISNPEFLYESKAFYDSGYP